MNASQAIDVPAQASLTRGLAIFLLLNALVLNGLVWLVSSGEYKETALQHTVDTLLGRSGDDFWGAMAIAVEYLEEREPVPLYTEVFFDQTVKFQYPPSALFALEAMYLAGPNTVRTSDLDVYTWPTVNDVLGWLFIALSIVATVDAVRAATASDTRLRPGPDPDHVALCHRCRARADFLSDREGVHAWPDPGLDQRRLCACVAVLGDRPQGQQRRADGTDLPDQAALRPVCAVGAPPAANGASSPPAS